MNSKIQCWVRNLERRPESSFWLQTPSDRFYPDFVCKLHDRRILVVEYKGEDRWSNDDSKEKRAVGELWAERSNGKCLFIMPNGKDCSAIDAAIGLHNMDDITTGPVDGLPMAADKKQGLK